MGSVCPLRKTVMGDTFALLPSGRQRKKSARNKRAKKKGENKCNDGGTALNEPFRGLYQTFENRTRRGVCYVESEGESIICMGKKEKFARKGVRVGDIRLFVIWRSFFSPL